MSKLQFFKHLLQLTEKKIQTQLKPNYFTTPSMGQFSNLRICLWKSLRLLKQNLLQVDAQLWYEEAFQDVSSSVCHTPVFCGHRWTNPQIFITSGSPAILVFPYQTRSFSIPNKAFKWCQYEWPWVNSTMRLISGTLCSTPLPWLSVPSKLNRQPYKGRLPLISWWKNRQTWQLANSAWYP